jgi:hypothetical protein
MIELTEQQAQALAASPESPPTVVDPKTKAAYVLVRRDVYEELVREHYDDSPWTEDEMAALGAEAGDLLDSFGKIPDVTATNP